MHPLDGARFKARRAKSHLDMLERNIQGFIKRHPYTVSKNNTGDYLEYFMGDGERLIFRNIPNKDETK